MADEFEFLCNICGKKCRCALARLTREEASCPGCGSNVRTRSLLHALSRELFQADLALNEFPVLKSLRGLGISDIPQYSGPLAEKFDYRNTFHDRAPQFDLMRPPAHELGTYDFVIVSDVLEHVPPPVAAGFHNAYALLKPGGLAVVTVPYSIEDAGTTEHFPELSRFAVTKVAGRAVLVNRTEAGRLQVFDKLVFHMGATPSLEMREFSERGVKQLLNAAGFAEIRWYGEDYLPYGIVWGEHWSLPLVLRKGPPAFGADTMRELMSELASARTLAQQRKSELDLLNRRRWVKLGRGFGGL